MRYLIVASAWSVCVTTVASQARNAQICSSAMTFVAASQSVRAKSLIPSYRFAV